MRQQVDVLEVKTPEVKAPIVERTLGSEPQSGSALQAENARLVALLEQHGIVWRAPPGPDSRHLRLYPPRTRTLSCTAQRGAAGARAVHGREGGAVSPAVPWPQRCPSGALGEQGQRQIRLRTRLCQ